jgi:hypothetical protein
MKTAEDEAFEEIERRQGGGFPAKRAMAADKLLEPVECLDCGSNNVGIPATYDSLVNSVKSQPVQEPVACVMGTYGGMFVVGPLNAAMVLPVGMALYAGPQRQWAGLTDEDRKAVLLTAYKEWECEELLLCAREDYLLIEQALKEKNT